MSIKLKVTDEDKRILSNCDIEARVLNKLLGERKLIMDSKARKILEVNGLSPELYILTFNVSKDTWEANLAPGALAIPTPGGNPIKVKEN